MLALAPFTLDQRHPAAVVRLARTLLFELQESQHAVDCTDAILLG